MVNFFDEDEMLEGILKEILKAHEKINNLDQTDNAERLKYDYERHLEELFTIYNEQFIKNILSKLLREKSFNPAKFDNAWLMYASKYINYGAVKMLLDDERVDPYAREDAALVNAFIKNDPVMAELIFSVYNKEIVDKKEDFFKDLLNYAVNRRHYKMAQLFLNKLVQE